MLAILIRRQSLMYSGAVADVTLMSNVAIAAAAATDDDDDDDDDGNLISMHQVHLVDSVVDITITFTAHH